MKPQRSNLIKSLAVETIWMWRRPTRQGGTVGRFRIRKVKAPDTLLLVWALARKSEGLFLCLAPRTAAAPTQGQPACPGTNATPGRCKECALDHIEMQVFVI